MTDSNKETNVSKKVRGLKVFNMLKFCFLCLLLLFIFIFLLLFLLSFSLLTPFPPFLTYLSSIPPLTPPCHLSPHFPPFSPPIPPPLPAPPGLYKSLKRSNKVLW